MTLLVDNQLPAALARFLTSLGTDCRRVLEVGLSQASDAEIWRYAAEHRLVRVSKDEDFFHRAMASNASAQLVWIRLGNCRNQHLITVMAKAWPRVCACLESGERIVEVR